MLQKSRTKPPFEPTDDERKLVEQMTACGIPQDSQCLVIRDGIDAKTLRKHFRRELDTAATMANAKVAGTLFNKAMSGDTTALIWWSKTRMGWKEKSEYEISGQVEFNEVRRIVVYPDQN
tara:strand:+ start:4204 stop:4563 length:360 start_codon:yes stop_codon:yes gene_type:complete